MNLAVVQSNNGVPIRLTNERWEHIVDTRPYMRNYMDQALDTVEDPHFILRAPGGILVAVKSYGRKNWLHVIYRELSRKDGFIITAYIKDSYNRDAIIWRVDEQ